MTDINKLITDNIDVWTSAIKKRNSQGRGSNKKIELTGVKKLRELILELAVRGKLVPQYSSDEPASVLLEGIAEEKAQLIVDKKIKKQKVLTAITDEEKSFELPIGWEKTRFGNIYVMEYGDSLPKPKRSNSGEYNVYGSNGVVGSHSQPSVNYPCIIIGRKGSAGALNLCIGDGCWVTDVAYSVVPPSGLDLNFAFLQFHTFGLDTLGKGIKPGLNRNEANLVIVAIPPLAEQYRIVAKVDELMALCDQLEQQTEQSLTAHQTLVEVLLAALTNCDSADDFQTSWQRIAEHFDVLFTTELSIEQLKQTILQLAVMGKLVPQNPSDQPASLLLEKIAEEKAQLIADKKIKKQKPLPLVTDEEEPFEQPKGWEFERLGNCSNVFSGNSFKSGDFNNESGTRVIKITNAGVGALVETDDYLPTEFLSTYENYKVFEGDLILALTRPYISTGLKISICPSAYNLSLLNQRVAAIRPYFESTFLYLFLSSNFVLKLYQDRFSGSGLQPNLKMGDVTELVIPIVPLAEQHRIVAKVDELIALCEQLKARLGDAQTTQIHLADAVVENALNEQAIN